MRVIRQYDVCVILQYDVYKSCVISNFSVYLSFLQQVLLRETAVKQYFTTHMYTNFTTIVIIGSYFFSASFFILHLRTKKTGLVNAYAVRSDVDARRCIRVMHVERRGAGATLSTFVYEFLFLPSSVRRERDEKAYIHICIQQRRLCPAIFE